MTATISRGKVIGKRLTLSLANYLFLLFWILKPFYIRESGSMQPADFIFIISFLVWVFEKRGVIPVDRRELPLLGFIAFTFIINGIYAAVYEDKWLLVSTLYYVYCFLVLLVVRDSMANRRFLKGLLWASAFNLIIQLLVLLAGLGNYMWHGYRFMGTFNDPNQYAFSMFTSFLLVFILSSYMKEKEHNRKKAAVLIFFALTAYFIIQGGSTGMLLGIGSFSVLFFITFLHSEKTPTFQLLKILTVIVVVGVVVLMTSRNVDVNSLDDSAGSGTFLLYRLFAKIDLVENGGIQALFQDRGLEKILTHPCYLLFGSGEGMYTRFPASHYEIHSTFPGILFYYGIIPFLFLLKWIKNNLSNTSRILIPAYLALLIESLTLAHQRQPAFWMIIMLGSLEYANARDLRKYRMMMRV